MRRALALLVLVASSGCFARFDGESPIGPGDEPWKEVGGGEGGVLLKGERTGALRITSPAGVRTLWSAEKLDGALLWHGALYHLDGANVVEHVIEERGLRDGHVLATVEGATLLALGDGEIAVARPGLVLAGRPGALRGLWEGDAAALAVDSARRRLWIVGRGELAVIDCVHLDRGEVLVRVPLPAALDSASARIVLSGESAAVYALDRSLDDALLVSPGAAPAPGRAIRLLATTVEEVAGASCDDGSVPPLLVPGERPAPPALAPNLTPGMAPDAPAPPPPPPPPRLGRIVPAPGGRFAVIDGAEVWGQISVTLVGSRLEEGCAPVRTLPAIPRGWPARVDGVGWDDSGVVLTCRDRRIVVGAKESPEVIELEPGLTSLRHGANLAINLVILAVEIPVETAGVVALAGLVVGTFPIWVWPLLASIH